jgi:hypothetical protein
MVSVCAQTPSVAYGRNLKNVTVTRRKFFSRGMPGPTACNGQDLTNDALTGATGRVRQVLLWVVTPLEETGTEPPGGDLSGR